MSRNDSLGRWLTVALLLSGAASVAAQTRMPPNWDAEVTRALRTPAYTGDLTHWQYDTFKATWRTANIAEAFVTFALNPDGTIEHLNMAAVSPLADFSLDYQDLLFVPAR